MSSYLFEEIPSVDLSEFTSGNSERKSLFVENLGNAFTEIGFVTIKNHGLTDDQIKKLYSAIKSFFDLPETKKQKYEVPELAGQRGYVSKGKEHAKGRNVGDLKEFFHVGQTNVPHDFVNDSYPDNIWPEEVPDFKDVTLEVYNTLENIGSTVLQAIALFLGLEESYFDNKVKQGHSILRPLHYFPINDIDSVPPDAVRAAEHGDINLITLLIGASASGLQVKRKDGKWIPITAVPDHLVVNVGDMLERLTNDRLKSTIHRVVNPPKEQMGTSRYSVPFFMHPKSNMDLTCLDRCVSKDIPKRYADITAGDFLDERLTELGLKK